MKKNCLKVWRVRYLVYICKVNETQTKNKNKMNKSKSDVNGLINLKSLFIESLKSQVHQDRHIPIMIEHLLYTVHFAEYFKNK